MNRRLLPLLAATLAVVGASLPPATAGATPTVTVPIGVDHAPPRAPLPAACRGPGRALLHLAITALDVLH